MSDLIDVDFRQLTSVVPAPEIGENMGRTVTVLQFRKKVIWHGFGGITRCQWTEWQDVRTEEE